MADASLVLAGFAHSLRYDDLPIPVVELVKRDILDTIGTALVGTAASGAGGLVELAGELGGKPESAIIGYGLRIPGPEAAQVNSFMARSADFDDAFDAPILHIGAVIVPAALAAAERRGKIIGKDFIVSVAVGMETVVRLGLAAEKERSDLSVYR